MGGGKLFWSSVPYLSFLVQNVNFNLPSLSLPPFFFEKKSTENVVFFPPPFVFYCVLLYGCSRGGLLPRAPLIQKMACCVETPFFLSRSNVCMCPLVPALFAVAFFFGFKKKVRGLCSLANPFSFVFSNLHRMFSTVLTARSCVFPF